MPWFVVPPSGGFHLTMWLRAPASGLVYPTLAGARSHIAALALAFALAIPASAQVVVELPFDVGTPERVIVSRSWTDPAPTPTHPPLALPTRTSPSSRKSADTPTSAPALPLPDLVSAIIAPTSAPQAGLTALRPNSPPPANLLLSSFNGDAASGGPISGTTWVGNVTQGSGYITVGGAARDDNGWGATGLTLDLGGMNSISITAQRNAGNTAGSLFLQFEDLNLRTRIFTLSTDSFALGAPTQAQIVLGVWSGDFDFTQIVGWSIGGGGVGGYDFRLSLYQVEFGTTAIPEPATTTAALALAALGAAFYRRRRG